MPWSNGVGLSKPRVLSIFSARLSLLGANYASRLFAIALLFGPLCPAQASDDFSWPRALKLQSLALGNALFEYYRGDELAAMTALQVADSRQHLAGQEQPAYALLASMQLRYGMYGEAERLFTQVLSAELPAGVREHVLTELVDLHYRAGEYDAAQQRLSVLPPLTDNERRERMASVRALLALANNEPATAAQALAEIPALSPRYRYALFNLGLTQMRLQQTEAASASFAQLQALPTISSADKALKDRSALAQGYELLRREHWSEAGAQFAQVRLNGPYSTKALLGLGWAQVYQGQHALALPAWTALNQRSSFDLSVQEGRLAIPYAYQQMGALPSALQHYELAEQAFEQALSGLQAEQSAIGNGQWLRRLQHMDLNTGELNSGEPGTDRGEALPPLFHELFASHRLRTGVLHYQQVQALQALLTDWQQRLPVYDDMVRNHEQRFAALAPRIDHNLQALDLAAWSQRLSELQTQMQAARQPGNWPDLANAPERKALARLEKAKARAAAISSQQLPISVQDPAQTTAPIPALSAQQQLKLRLLSGVLQFEIEQAAVPRQWQMQREAQQAQAALIELNSHQSRLLAARTVAGERYARYQERIGGLRARLAQLHSRSQTLAAQQAGFLQQLLLGEIERWRGQLSEYRLQAQLSRARMLDAASREHAP